MNYDLHKMSRDVRYAPWLITATMGISLLGCAEKSWCYHQCWEPALNGFDSDTKSCGVAEDQTQEECAQFDPCGGRKARTSWRDVPKWCSGIADKYRSQQ
jgi:hypothetical protein